MKQYNFKTSVLEILADTVTPVSVYLKMRDIFRMHCYSKVPIITVSRTVIPLYVLNQKHLSRSTNSKPPKNILTVK